MTHSQQKQNVGVEALQKLVAADVPAFEQSYITMDLLQAVVNIVLEAADANAAFADLKSYRDAQVPWYEKGAITDDTLLKIAGTVLNSTANVA